MNKKSLVDMVAEKLDKTKSDTRLLIDTVFDAITEQLKAGESVRIVGFGEFEVRQRVQREGRNPQTGSKMTISATKTPSFLAGKTLKDAVKNRPTNRKRKRGI